MRSRLIPICLLCLLEAGAQTAPPAQQFIAASVKSSKSPIAVARPTLTKSRLTWEAEPFRIIAWAYDVTWDRVSGIPDPSPNIQIEATFPSETSVPQVRAMLRGLLAERMGLVSHVVTTNESGYAIARLRTAPKIKPDPPAADDAPSAGFVSAILQDGGVSLIRSRGSPLSDLASTLQRNLRRPVADQTGLAGNFTFEFRYARDDDPSVSAPSLAGAIRTELGLSLDKKTLPVRSVVVDQILKAPTEN